MPMIEEITSECIATESNDISAINLKKIASKIEGENDLEIQTEVVTEVETEVEKDAEKKVEKETETEVVLPVIDEDEFQRKIAQANRVVDRLEREETTCDIFDKPSAGEVKQAKLAEIGDGEEEASEQTMTEKLKKKELEDKYPRFI